MFYGNLARKENINIIIVRFYVSFANFDQSKGYKDIKLATRPQLAIRAQVELYIPKGTFATITYEKPVWGSDAWASDITKTKDNKHTAEFLGLARSAEYAIKADEAAYLKEVKAIISHWQRDIAKGLQENL